MTSKGEGGRGGGGEGVGALEASRTWRPDRWPPGRCPFRDPRRIRGLRRPRRIRALRQPRRIRGLRRPRRILGLLTIIKPWFTFVSIVRDHRWGLCYLQCILVFVCVVSICSTCAVKLIKMFWCFLCLHVLSKVAAHWVLLANVLMTFLL